MTATTSNAGYGDLSVFVSKVFLERFLPSILLTRFVEKDSIPANSSRTWKKQRLERIAPLSGYDSPSVKAVVEGTVPSETVPTLTTITTSLSQYGNVMRVSDVVDLVHETNVFSEYIKLNGENMKETIERVYYAGVVNGTQSLLALDSAGTTTGSRASVAGTINAPLLDKAIKTLQLANVPFMFKGAIGASTGFNTSGILPAYMGIVESNVLTDLAKIPGFIPVNQYPSGKAEADEVGSYRHIRFFLSNLAPVVAGAGAAASGTVATGGNNDVFQVLVFGDPAITAVDIAKSMVTKVIPPGTADSANPIGQWGSVSWKAMCNSVITNDTGVVRLELAASA